MEFDYNADQRALRDEANRFLERASPLTAARAVLDDSACHYDASLWLKIAEQGWLGAVIPEAQGGLDLGPVELAAIAEAVGASLAPIPFGSTLYVLVQALLMAGSDEQKARYLPAIARGEIIGCGAIFEGPGDFASDCIATHFSNGTLSGVKQPVVDGCIATLAVVAARGDDGVGLCIVTLDAPEVEVRALEAVDGSINVAQIRFDKAEADWLPGGSPDAIERLLATAAVYYAFEQIGGADRCLQTALAYVRERQAFGGPIGRFQAVKHKLADMFTANELARSHAYHSVWGLSQPSDVLIGSAAAARVAASDAYWFAASEGLHLHGAIGFTWEQDSQLFYRRAHHLALVVGGPQWWKDCLFDHMASRTAVSRT